MEMHLLLSVEDGMEVSTSDVYKENYGKCGGTMGRDSPVRSSPSMASCTFSALTKLCLTTCAYFSTLAHVSEAPLSSLQFCALVYAGDCGMLMPRQTGIPHTLGLSHLAAAAVTRSTY